MKSEKRLRWPSSALGSSSSSLGFGIRFRKRQSPSTASSSSKKQNTGEVISVALCRRKVVVPKRRRSRSLSFSGVPEWKRKGDKEEEKMSDALDALRLMSLMGSGGDNSVLGSVTSGSEKDMLLEALEEHSQGDEESLDRMEEDGEEEEEENDETPENELILCCLTNIGKLHFFSAMELLRDQPATRNEDTPEDMALSFATLLFGQDLHTIMKNTILPLSDPLATVSLSLCSSRKASVRGNTGRGPLMDLYLIDASIEPTRHCDQTFFNMATHCIQAFDYVVVCGKGMRRRRKRKVTGDGKGQEEPELVDEEEERGDAVQDASNWWESDPTLTNLDEEEDDEEEDNEEDEKDASSSLSAEEVVEQEPPTQKQPDDQTWEWVEGGFLTFLSLRHFQETRSLFLPFAPDKLAPITWGGMDMLIVSRDETVKISSSEEPIAMAVRVDANLKSQRGVVSSGVGDAPPLSIVNVKEDGAKHDDASGEETFREIRVETSKEESSVDERKKKLSRWRLRRFRPVPILLTDDLKSDLHSRSETNNSNIGEDGEEGDCVLSTKISSLGITSGSTPPALIITYTITTKSWKKEMVSLHSFSKFEYYRREKTKKQQQAVVAFKGKRGLMIRTVRAPGHWAMIHKESVLEEQEQVHRPTRESPTWCLGGQGWSLIGNFQSGLHFVCWEGASSSHGAFVQLLTDESSLSDTITTTTSPVTTSFYLPLYTTVLPLTSPTTKPVHHRFPPPLPGTTLIPGTSITTSMFQKLSLHQQRTQRSRSESAAFAFEVEDELIQEALMSICPPQPAISPTMMRGHSIPQHGSRRYLSKVEKSRRLLRYCSSWNELDEAERGSHEMDEKVIMVSLQSFSGETYSITMRKRAILNGIAAPFNQILAWMCHRKDYYAAASIALNLLNDTEAVGDLRGRGRGGIVDDHNFLLDGIHPPRDLDVVTDDEDCPKKSQLTFLADMAVGCLVKGGSSMAYALEGFLSRNVSYDASRTCLLLAATAAKSISELTQHDDDTYLDYDDLDDESKAITCLGDALWPIQCLLQVAISRNFMSTALVLLNATIPHELRRQHNINVAAHHYSRLCEAIVGMIVASSPNAAACLLDMRDEDGVRYWQSLRHETRLALGLVSVGGKYPLLREEEVRGWALRQLGEKIGMEVKDKQQQQQQENAKGGEEDTSAKMEDENEYSAEERVVLVARGQPKTLPSKWVSDLCVASLCNSTCSYEQLLLSASMTDQLEAIVSFDRNDNDNTKDDEENDRKERIGDVLGDGLEDQTKYKSNIHEALLPHAGSGGHDFNLLIATLLLLQLRSYLWKEDAIVSTQDVLNEICDLAGRQFSFIEEADFAFDGCLAMKQCALAGNVMAAANLIGGKDGLVLKCSHVLMNTVGLTMEESERFLLGGGNTNDLTYSCSDTEDDIKADEMSFRLTDAHRGLLWLMDEHVLSVTKFGEFDTSHSRGRIDPVFAARICLRAWLCLIQSKPDTIGYCESAATYLVKWLRTRLGMMTSHHRSGGNVRKKRLASAALTRALLWPDGMNGEADGEKTTEVLLAEKLMLDAAFLVELAQSCCGLIECLPRKVAMETFHSAPQTDSVKKKLRISGVSE